MSEVSHGPELIGLANIAGFSPNRKSRGIAHDEWAAAIALAESGGNPRAHNAVFPDNSYGLMQINMLAHSKKKLGISKNDDLYDPLTNMRAAYIVYNEAGKTFRPWSTYPSRAALQMPKVRGSLQLNKRQLIFDARGTITKLGTIPPELGTVIADDVPRLIGLLGKSVGEGLGEFTEDTFGLGLLTDWLESAGLRVAAFIGGGLMIAYVLTRGM